MKKLFLLISLCALALAQNTAFTTGQTKINNTQIQGPSQAPVQGILSVTEQNVVVGQIATGLNFTVPSGGCQYMQVFLNGLIQTAGQNVDYALGGGVITFNNNTVQPGSTIKIVCFNVK